ncbi:hypothetical protein UNH65_06435 [Chitinophaga sp. 180180018-2]|nr:hypothetical protein [Chitinophaga sp. 212800010-3]
MPNSYRHSAVNNTKLGDSFVKECAGDEKKCADSEKIENVNIVLV